MRHIKTNHFEKIVIDYNILTFGDKELIQYDVILAAFNETSFLEKTEYNIENLYEYIIGNDVNILVLSISENSLWTEETTIQALRDIQKNTNVRVITIINSDDVTQFAPLINLSGQVIVNDNNYDLMKSKLYNIVTYLLNVMIGNRKKRERYLDFVESDIITVVEQLEEIAVAIDDGDISDKVFGNLQLGITKAKQVIQLYNQSSDTIKDFFEVFERFTYTFDKESMDVANIAAFNYLARLLEDTAGFMDKYFIEKKIDDIYVVEDSLRNSLQFMMDSFEGKQKSPKDLELF